MGFFWGSSFFWSLLERFYALMTATVTVCHQMYKSIFGI
uniref:Uncharacterized protein n=1 Tax=Anguilla anguilla TaxID=7936 RepID=A0A0E9PU08_ANGAN